MKLFGGTVLTGLHAYDVNTGRFVYVYNCRLCRNLEGKTHEVYSVIPCRGEGCYVCRKHRLRRVLWTFTGLMMLSRHGASTRWVTFARNRVDEQ